MLSSQRKKEKGPIDRKLARKLILRVLINVEKPIYIKETFNEILKIFEPTKHDLEILSGKEERWKNTTRWELSSLVREGKIIRVKEETYALKR